VCKNTKLVLSLALFALLSAGQSVLAQPTTQSTQTLTQESQSPNPSLLSTATNLSDNSTTLETRLLERKMQAQKQVENWQIIVNSLKSEIEKDKQNSKELSDKLTQAEAELLKSQADLMETSTSLDESKKTVKNLSKDFEDYKKASNDKIHKLEIKVMVYKGVGVTIAIAGTAYAGYVIGHSYKLW